MIKEVDGGICAAQGFLAAGVHCGIRKNRTKRDLGLIISEVPAAAAAIYTKNLVKGAPIAITKKHIADGFARGVIVNSGNANTCNADGEEIAESMCRLAAEGSGEFSLSPEDFMIASTGVIGQPLPIEPIADGIPMLYKELSRDGSNNTAEAIMTTDTKKKEIAVSFEIGGKTCTIGGIAKGSGMIHPNMATMLVFLTTDASIDSGLLHKALRNDADNTFHMISVDGDTSTNDMVCIMANGMAGNEKITEEGESYDAFCAALSYVTSFLCRAIAADGEGASHLLTCRVQGASDITVARVVAKSVICSSLTKAAIFGADANWGRVLCAIGYAGVDVDVTKIDVDFVSDKGRLPVCRSGAGVPFDEDIAKEILTEKEVIVDIFLNSGNANATAWGCDLTYDYVKINGDYRT